jgi:hypothetical protein
MIKSRVGHDAVDSLMATKSTKLGRFRVRTTIVAVLYSPCTMRPAAVTSISPFLAVSNLDSRELAREVTSMSPRFVVVI